MFLNHAMKKTNSMLLNECRHQLQWICEREKHLKGYFRFRLSYRISLSAFPLYFLLESLVDFKVILNLIAANTSIVVLFDAIIASLLVNVFFNLYIVIASHKQYKRYLIGSFCSPHSISLILSLRLFIAIIARIKA